MQQCINTDMLLCAQLYRNVNSEMTLKYVGNKHPFVNNYLLRSTVLNKQVEKTKVSKSSQRCSTDADWSQPLCPYHNKHITYYFNIISGNYAVQHGHNIEQNYCYFLTSHRIRCMEIQKVCLGNEYKCV